MLPGIEGFFRLYSIHLHKGSRRLTSAVCPATQMVAERQLLALAGHFLALAQPLTGSDADRQQVLHALLPFAADRRAPQAGTHVPRPSLPCCLPQLMGCQDHRHLHVHDHLKEMKM